MHGIPMQRAKINGQTRGPKPGHFNVKQCGAKKSTEFLPPIASTLKGKSGLIGENKKPATR